MVNAEGQGLKRRLVDVLEAPADDRSRMRAVANNLILHLHPTKVPVTALRFTYTWGLGGLSALLVALLALTGVLLMFRYDANVDGAYASIIVLETQVPLGSLVRSIHHWSANLLVVTAFLHLLRVFFTGGFKQGRGLNWGVGMVLLLLVLAFNFTGYLLPWDQLAFWAITVGTSLLDYVPLVGPALAGFLIGGPEVGQVALRNFYALHVAVLPVVLVMLLSYHFWKVRKDGGISQPAPGPRERVEKVTTIPHLVKVELAAALVLVAAILIFAMFVPAPLETMANPVHPPNPAKAAWYFLGLQELLLHMHPLAAMSLTGILIAALFIVPRLDREDADAGHYFRSTAGRRLAIAGALMALIQFPILIVADEWWIDFNQLLPGVSTLVSNGFVPLALSVAGLLALYGAFRKMGRASRGEALLGIFSYLSAGLIVLTITGIFFRGPGMALIWPF